MFTIATPISIRSREIEKFVMREWPSKVDRALRRAMFGFSRLRRHPFWHRAAERSIHHANHPRQTGRRGRADVCRFCSQAPLGLSRKVDPKLAGHSDGDAEVCSCESDLFSDSR